MAQLKELTKSDVRRNLGRFNADERETSILFDHTEGVVYIETTKHDVARRLFDIAAKNGFSVNRNVDSFSITVPAEHVRAPELIIKHTLR